MDGMVYNIAQIEEIRQELHKLIDTHIDNFIKQHIAGNTEANSEDSTIKYSLLSCKTSIFKGTKPVSVVFPNGHIEQTNTWKKVVSVILKDCNSNKTMHDSLTELTGKLFGNFRSILSNNPDKLKAPIQIDDDLYFEAKYDTDTLLYVLRERVLSTVGYPYETILIQYKEKDKPKGTEP